jgi:steroid delta-isomerase-like uncharacterized protein
MSEIEKETLVRNYFKDFNSLRGNSNKFIDVISKPYFTAEFIAHYSTGDMNIDQYSKYGMSIVSAFPDLKQDIEDIFAHGDKVAVRITLHGTHRGTFSGVPATNRELNIQGALIFRIPRSKFAEVWAFPNELGLLRQLGILPNILSRK